MNVKIGSRVQHRGWFWRGTIIEVPNDLNYLSTVKVKRDDGKVEDIWIPSLITNSNDFVYDWGDVNEAIERGPKSKSKKPKHKRKN